MPTSIKTVASAVLLLSFAPNFSWSQTKVFSDEEIAKATADPDRFTIDAKSIAIGLDSETVPPALLEVKPLPLPVPGGDGGIDLGAIINIGKTIWDIIEKNKAVVDIKTQYAVAIPRGMANWDQLSGWQPPQATTYKLSANNVYGMQVVKLQYQLLRTSGGSFNGKGKYLTGVTIEPFDVNVDWGYRFSLTAEVPNSTIVNVGDKENPIAAMQMHLKWQIQTPVKILQGASAYYLQGDGTFREIGGSSRNSFRQPVEKAIETILRAEISNAGKTVLLP